MKPIIAIDIKGNTLSDGVTTIKPESFEQLMDFLMADRPDGYLCVWNLYHLVGLMRKFMPEQVYLDLLEKDKVWHEHYKLFSVSGKVLSIGHEYKKQIKGNFYESTKKEINIYNLYRFYPNYTPETLDDIRRKGVELLTTLETMGIYNPKTLASAISIFADNIMEKAEIPHIYDCPEEALDMADYALQMMNREWKATYQVGYFKNATTIDINAAYPSLVKSFGDLSTAKFWYSKSYQPCDFGIFKGMVTITGDTPIVDSDKQPKVGRYPDYISTEQWAYLNKYRKGHFEPEGGWMFKYQTDRKPCEKIMVNLYAQRKQGGLLSDLSKAISVGLIGQFSQHYPTEVDGEDKKGKFYNPIYSVMATSQCSLKVGINLETLGLWDSLVYGNVDGVIVDKVLQLGDGLRALGDFRSETVDALVLSINHKFTGEKKDDYLKLIKRYPKERAYNDIVLCPEMNITNRVFKDYPQNGKEWIGGKFRSEPLTVQP